MFLPKPAPAVNPALVRKTAETVAKRSGSNTENYRSPVDFQSLQKLNPDICAWLYVPGTQINQPVLQNSDESEDFYRTHTFDGQTDEYGCLFTQARYNGKDFRDPVTVIYGPRKASGEMFGSLEKTYSERDALRNFSVIYVFSPDRELQYQVFGSSAYNKDHILHTYQNFKDPGQIPVFLSDLQRYHTMTYQFDDSISVTESDRILILSTSLSQNQDQRYLVLAKLVDEIS